MEEINGEAGGTLQHSACKSLAILQNRAKMGFKVGYVCVCVHTHVFILRAGKLYIKKFGK